MKNENGEVVRERLGKILVQRGVISDEQLSAALAEQKKSGLFIGAVLVSKGLVSEEQAAMALAEQSGMAYVDLESQPVEAEALSLIPENLCRAHQAVPLFAMGDSVTVAMANPMDAQAVEALQKSVSLRVHPVFATPSAISRALEKKAPKNSPKQEVKTVEVFSPANSGSEAVATLKAAASLAPVIRLVNEFIGDAVSAGASDIHLEPSRNKYFLRFRIDGLLYDKPELPQEFKAAIISRIKIMAEMDIAEKRLPQDGRAQVSAAGRSLDLRVSTFPTMYGEKIVIRLLDKQRALLTLEQLGFSKEVFSPFVELIAKPHGIVLVTGPTGSGKTTTLYAVLNRLNHPEVNIMTLEDPVEYELPRVSQSQVNLKAGLSFATGLRSMVRQDPDIILIGEIRDKETADIAIHASLTGHMVYSTLHTNDATSAPARLVDMGVEPFLVATSLIGVLAQRLVRTLCPACKKPSTLSPELRERLGLEKAAGIGKIFTEVGCPACRNTGYQGRTGLYELFVPTESVRNLILKKAPAGLIREEACRFGMKTLQQDVAQKLIAGVTSAAEVFRITGQE